jgi:hypothetical protein
MVATPRRDSRSPRRAHAGPRYQRLPDLYRLRLWIDSKPEVPEGLWYKDFGSFNLCGEGRYPKTFLLGRAGSRRSRAVNAPALFPGRFDPPPPACYTISLCPRLVAGFRVPSRAQNIRRGQAQHSCSSLVVEACSEIRPCWGCATSQRPVGPMPENVVPKHVVIL